jgi:hypothetical protein
MNKDNAKDFLPLVAALAEGKEVEHLRGDGVWRILSEYSFNGKPERYRIKPAPMEFWVNVYGNPENPSTFAAHPTKQEAEMAVRPGVTRVAIHFKEVKDE